MPGTCTDLLDDRRNPLDFERSEAARAEMIPPLRAPTTFLRIPVQGKSDVVLRERRLRRTRGAQILQFGDLQLPIETIHLREAVSQVRQPPRKTLGFPHPGEHPPRIAVDAIGRV